MQIRATRARFVAKGSFGAARRHMALRFDHERRVADAPLSVVLFTERLDATYYAYFHYALHSLADDRRVSFHVMDSGTVMRHWGGPSLLAARICRRVAPHVVVFNRYALPDGAELARQFRRRGRVVLYHIDDDLLAIPAELGTDVSAHHGDPRISREREAVLAEADVVQPSTHHLAERLRARLPSTKVIEPSHPPYPHALLEAADMPGGPAASPIIGYMASKSHGGDLELVLPAIVSIMERRPEARFEMFGTLTMPDELERRFPGRVQRHHAVNDYREFLRRLAGFRWSVGLAPLLPTAFNACKSAIKYLEYTAAGIPTVASPGPAYTVIESGTNGLLADSPERWAACIGQLLDDREYATSLVSEAHRDCESLFGFGAAKLRLVSVFARLSAGRESELHAGWRPRS